MKKGLHPNLNDIKATCVCGTVFETKSTKGNINIGICSKCHPFYTGKHKFVDAEGRIEKFMAKFQNFNKFKNNA